MPQLRQPIAAVDTPAVQEEQGNPALAESPRLDMVEYVELAFLLQFPDLGHHGLGGTR